MEMVRIAFGLNCANFTFDFFKDFARDGKILSPGMLPMLRVQRMPRWRSIHGRCRQQDLLRQRLSSSLRAEVRWMQEK